VRVDIGKKLRLFAVCGALAATAGYGAAVPCAAKDRPDPAYLRSYQEWKAELIADREDNWLPLAGLFWLKQGVTHFGSDPANEIVLPSSVDASTGSIERDGDLVRITFLPGVQAKVDGKIEETALLRSDDPGPATMVELGSLRMHIIKRGQRVGLRVKDLKSPRAQNYKDPVFYPVNLAYRVTARWIPATGKQMVDVPDVVGEIIPTPVAGTAVFRLNGREVRLTDLGGNAEKSLFFVFDDLTNKSTTYPGGRFLDTGPVVNGKVMLDFNEAYNPPCAVTPYATCPLAPRQNRLGIAIPAGEKYSHKPVPRRR
jgi:uncharacterized protein